MKWHEDLSAEMVFESRWVRLRRQMKRLLVVVLVLASLAFLAMHPTGQRLVMTSKTVGQTVWQWAAAQVLYFWGPEPLLRQRAKWTIATLKEEMVRLQAIETASTRRGEALQRQLPPLLQAQQAASAELLTRTLPSTQEAMPDRASHDMQSSSLRNTGVPLANWGAQVMTYSDIQEQVGSCYQALRLHEATLVQARALQHEVQQQMTALETTLNLFAQRWQQRDAGLVEQALTAGELLAFRRALQVQLARAQAIRDARRALEAVLLTIDEPTEPQPEHEHEPSLTHVE